MDGEKNAQDTSVIAIGERSRKVLNYVHVTKAEDPVTQRHEVIGTRKIYEDLDSRDISVNMHTHDRNMAINKLVREREHGFTCNQNDLWHGIKSGKKGLDCCFKWTTI
jgi:phosphopantetheine adenylyltransferase